MLLLASFGDEAIYLRPPEAAALSYLPVRSPFEVKKDAFFASQEDFAAFFLQSINVNRRPLACGVSTHAESLLTNKSVCHGDPHAKWVAEPSVLGLVGQLTTVHLITTSVETSIGLQHLLKEFRVYGAAKQSSSLRLASITWLQLQLCER